MQSGECADDQAALDDPLLDAGVEARERVDNTGDALHDVTQRVVRTGPGFDERRLDRTGQLLHVAFEVVGFRGGHLRGHTRLGYGFRPLGDTVRTGLIQRVRGAHRVRAENRVHRRVALLHRQAAHTLLQLARERFEADELAGRVVRVDAELFHRGRGLFGGAGEALEHAFEAGAGVGADHARVREQ